MSIRNINFRKLLFTIIVITLTSLLLASSPHQTVFARPASQTAEILAPVAVSYTHLTLPTNREV